MMLTQYGFHLQNWSIEKVNFQPKCCGFCLTSDAKVKTFNSQWSSVHTWLAQKCPPSWWFRSETLWGKVCGFTVHLYWLCLNVLAVWPSEFGLPTTPTPIPPLSPAAERPEGLSLLSCGALCPLSKCRHIPLPSAYDLTAPVCLTPSPKANLIIAL